MLLCEFSGVMLQNLCSFSNRTAYFQGEVARRVAPSVELRRTYAIMGWKVQGKMSC